MIIPLCKHPDWKRKITQLFSMHNGRNSLLNDRLREEFYDGSMAYYNKIEAFLHCGATPIENDFVLPRIVEPVWDCSIDVVELLLTKFFDVLGLPDNNFQTALGKAIEYGKLDLLENFGEPNEIRGTVFQWVSESCL